MDGIKIEPTIMIVEDDMDTSKMLSYVLKSIGYKRILTAQNGKEALSLLDTKGLICIISDWNMPRMNGMDFFHHFRKHHKSGRIPFLLLTTESYKEKVVEAISSGVTDYIVKPFSSDVLEKKLRKVLGTKYLSS